MRELLKKEIAMYAETVEPPLDSSFILKESTNHGKPTSKNTTIDDLMSQYFDSVEENYPSIVANVVRTSGRLLPLPLSKNPELCHMCRCPIEKSQQAWAGDQVPLTDMTNKINQNSDDIFSLCYGCNRAIR